MPTELSFAYVKPTEKAINQQQVFCFTFKSDGSDEERKFNFSFQAKKECMCDFEKIIYTYINAVSKEFDSQRNYKGGDFLKGDPDILGEKVAIAHECWEKFRVVQDEIGSQKSKVEKKFKQIGNLKSESEFPNLQKKLTKLEAALKSDKPLYGYDFEQVLEELENLERFLTQVDKLKEAVGSDDQSLDITAENAIFKSTQRDGETEGVAVKESKEGAQLLWAFLNQKVADNDELQPAILPNLVSSFVPAGIASYVSSSVSRSRCGTMLNSLKALFQARPQDQIINFDRNQQLLAWLRQTLVANSDDQQQLIMCYDQVGGCHLRSRDLSELAGYPDNFEDFAVGEQYSPGSAAPFKSLYTVVAEQLSSASPLQQILLRSLHCNLVRQYDSIVELKDNSGFNKDELEGQIKAVRTIFSRTMEKAEAMGMGIDKSAIDEKLERLTAYSSAEPQDTVTSSSSLLSSISDYLKWFTSSAANSASVGSEKMVVQSGKGPTQ